MSAVKRGFMFTSISGKKPKKNVFNLSYDNKFTANMGGLYPFYVQDVLPNDKFKVKQEYILKAQPLIAPIMHRVDVYQHYFFVPLRLIWDNFEKFITGGEDGMQTAEMPYVTANFLASISDKHLIDLLGYPTDVSNVSQNNDKFSSLRLRAYNFIINEFFRDQNLMDELNNSKEDGSDNNRINCEIVNRCWKKDYFTSALPFPQRGATVGLPFSGGTVELDPDSEYHFQQLKYGDGSVASSGLVGSNKFTSPGAPAASNRFGPIDNDNQVIPSNLDPNGTLKVSDDFFISINDFRRASRLQQWLERNARAGARYVEQIASHFGIHPSDYRLQRPQYLGGGKQPFVISEVVQTSTTEDGSTTTTPQGNQAGVGSGYSNQFVFKETFEEHGIIIGLMSVLPKASYQQGVSRHLTKFDKFDFAFPEFGNLGEQEIYNKEVCYIQGSDHYNESLFGYQSRYAEYKYNPDEVHGDFKDSLAFWHLGRIFDKENPPALNSDFVKAQPDKRVFAVETQDEDCLLFDVYNDVTAVRALPAYGTPTL